MMVFMSVKNVFTFINDFCSKSAITLIGFPNFRYIVFGFILWMNSSTIPFIENESIDWQDYFSDMIGVSKAEGAVLENVVLHFNQLTGKYMENKSIHETQKHKWIDENTLEVKIEVMINYELERLILSYGESVRVVEPLHLKEIIKSRLLNGLNNY